MKYITDIHALNLPCSLGTTGDWHTAAIQWNNPHMLDTKYSPFGEWGIEPARPIPEHPNNSYPIANHLRALLDMILCGHFDQAQGMNGNYIDTDEYNKAIFEKIYLLKDSPNWREIDRFMEREYLMKWVKFKKEQFHG